MEEKDGIVMFDDKMYNLDEMTDEEIDELINKIEEKQKELEKEVMDM